MKKLDLNEFRSAKRAANGIEITAGDKTFVIDPPELWPDSAQDLAKAGDNVGLVTLLIGGPEKYAEFIELGGSSAMIGSIIQEQNGLSAGE